MFCRETGTIEVELRLNGDGLIESVVSRGHAVKRKGTTHSVCCALVSSSLRSFSVLVLERDGLIVDGDVAKPGSLDLFVKRMDPGLSEWYRGICEMVIRELEGIALEYPKIVSLIKTGFELEES